MNMRPAFWYILAGVSVCLAFGQETPLTSLPYTPSLEPKFMDRSVDPCTDFYKFSCGNWNKLNPIPADQPGWSVVAKLTDENFRFLWGILQQAADSKANRTPNEQKIGDFFHACMDEAVIERNGWKPLEPALTKIAALRSVDDIAPYIAEQQKTTHYRGVLFAFGSSPDYDNSSQEIAFAGSAGFSLPDPDYYTKTDAKSQEIRDKYLQHIARMLQMIGESAPDAQADAQAAMEIETALAQSSLTPVQERDPYNLKHKYSREEFQRIAPRFDWDAFFSTLNPPAFEQLNVTEPKFFEEMNRQLTTQKLSAWRAYLRWRLVRLQAPYLSSGFVKGDFDFYSRYLRGTQQLPARWKTCTRLVDQNLGEALGQVFVAKTFAPQTKADILKMTEQIESEMEEDIKDLQWMSDATKQQSLKKLHGILNNIGYPDQWRDYSSVVISRHDFFGDVNRATEFEVLRHLNKIGKSVNRSEWFMSPPTVEFYYHPKMNTINLLAGMLQPPFYDPKMDAAPNYGNAGAGIGHELTHGFDDQGRKFDAAGNLRDWWTPADAKAFEDRVNCVRDQYAKYVVIDDIHINSKLTSGEDVAELGGALLAYLAWKHATAGQELQPIDGLTPEQRFWVGYGQWACEDQRPEMKRLSATVDPHSPGEYRINGVVSDLPEFGQAFGCKVGQPMMRANACRVW